MEENNNNEGQLLSKGTNPSTSYSNYEEWWYMNDILAKLREETEKAHSKAMDYITLNLEVAEKGVNIDKEVYSQNLTFLLGRYSGLKETLKQIEDTLNFKEK